VEGRLVGDDECEAANLAYCSYWIGEGLSPVTGDELVAGLPWRGDRLLTHLTGRLDAAQPYVELSAHTLWALTDSRPFLLLEDPDRAAALAERAEHVLASATAALSQRGRRELGIIRQAAVTAATGRTVDEFRP